MNELIWALLKAHFALVLLFLFWKITSAKSSDFHFNRIALLLIPFLAILVGVVNIPAFYYSSEFTPEIYLKALEVQPVSGKEKGTWLGALKISEIIVFAYFLGCLIVFGFGLLNIVRIARLIIKLPKSANSEYTLINTSELPIFSFMHYLFWNEEWVQGEKEKNWIFSHELIHIRRKHSLDILL